MKEGGRTIDAIRADVRRGEEVRARRERKGDNRGGKLEPGKAATRGHIPQPDLIARETSGGSNPTSIDTSMG